MVTCQKVRLGIQIPVQVTVSPTAHLVSMSTTAAEENDEVETSKSGHLTSFEHFLARKLA